MADAGTRIRRWFDEIWNHGNLAVIDEYMGPETVIHDAGPQPGDVTTPEEFRLLATAMRAAFPDMAVTIEDTIVQGERVALRFTATGTHQGPFLGAQATGRRFTISGMAIGEWRGDRLLRGWNNIDMLSLFAQLGLVQRP